MSYSERSVDSKCFTSPQIVLNTATGKGFSFYCLGLYKFSLRDSTGTLEHWPGVIWFLTAGRKQMQYTTKQPDFTIARRWAVPATAAADTACSLQIPSQYKSPSAKLGNGQDAEHQGQSSSV